mgnify:CR=1 FL=1
MRQPAEFFDDVDIVLVHIASTLRGALKLESLLTDNGLDYAVETDSYRSGLIFRTERVGAFFYVAAADADWARSLMRAHRFKVVPDEVARST